MKTNQRLLQEVRRSGLLFGLTVLLGVVTGAMVLLQAQKLSTLINSVFLEHQPLAAVIPLFASLLLIVLLRGIFTFLSWFHRRCPFSIHQKANAQPAAAKDQPSGSGIHYR